MGDEMIRSFVVRSNPQEDKAFDCQYCDRRFYSSQALGGHQNCHKQERLVSRMEQKELERRDSLERPFYASPILYNNNYIQNNMISYPHYSRPTYLPPCRKNPSISYRNHPYLAPAPPAAPYRFGFNIRPQIFPSGHGSSSMLASRPLPSSAHGALQPRRPSWNNIRNIGVENAAAGRNANYGNAGGNENIVDVDASENGESDREELDLTLRL